MSAKPTYGQLHVLLAENQSSIRCPPSHNFRIARNPTIIEGKCRDHFLQADLG
jgi:hypothetical protein